MSDLQLADPRSDTNGATSSADRALARKRIDRRRNLQGTLVAYGVVVIGAWAIATGSYLVWPGWIVVAWGVALLLGLWEYWRGPATDTDIDEELRRMRRMPRRSGSGRGQRRHRDRIIVDVMVHNTRA